MVTLTIRPNYPQLLTVADWLADLSDEEFSIDAEPHDWFYEISEALTRNPHSALAELRAAEAARGGDRIAIGFRDTVQAVRFKLTFADDFPIETTDFVA